MTTTPVKIDDVDVAAVVAAELDRRKALEAEAEAHRFDHPTGGGCRYCGATASMRILEGKPHPGWDGDGSCYGCRTLFSDWAASEDHDRKILVCMRLLETNQRPYEAIVEPRRFVARLGFQWFSESRWAEPSSTRWAFVNLSKLAASWEEASAGPKHVPKWLRGKKCAKCGVKDRWTVNMTTMTLMSPPRDGEPPVKEQADGYRCGACQHIQAAI